MDSIYTRGDAPLLSNWTYKNYLYWLGALLAYYKLFADRPTIGGQLDGETKQDIVGSLKRVKSTLVEYEKGLYQLE